jgi:hypothetical protein
MSVKNLKKGNYNHQLIFNQATLDSGPKVKKEVVATTTAASEQKPTH